MMTAGSDQCAVAVRQMYRVLLAWSIDSLHCVAVSVVVSAVACTLDTLELLLQPVKLNNLAQMHWSSVGVELAATAVALLLSE